MRARTSNLIWAVVAEAAAAADMSFGERSDLLDGALLSQFGCDASGCRRFWLQDIFSDYVIARSDDGKLYRIGYTMDGDEVSLSDAQEVETAYVPVAEAAHFVAEAADAETDDAVYPVSVLRAGWGGGVADGLKLPHYYPPAFVAQVAEAVNNAKFGRKHPEKGYGENDPERIAGWFTDGTVADVKEARARLNLLDRRLQL